MMTNPNGAILWRAIYRPFGEVQQIIGGQTLDYRFPGQWFMLETGLHYNWHRWYDATTGRYTQPDPIGMPDGPSRYAYARNSPLMYVDPDGLYTEVIQWGRDPSFRGRWGHISGNINGRNFSYGSGGWDDDYPAASDYARRQGSPAIDRGGRGIILDLSPKEERVLEQCLTNSDNYSPITYNPILNNCGSPWIRCLSGLGVVDPTNRAHVLPTDVFDVIRRSPRAIGSISYPGSHPPQ
jgi:RHS repeat-associated protein